MKFLNQKIDTVRITVICFFMSLALFQVRAQDKPAGERVVEEGVTYYLHTVKAGETLFSIAKHYQITLEEVNRANPSLAGTIRPGDVLKVPAGAEKRGVEGSSSQQPAHIILHKVQRKETLYFISRKYGVSIDEILSYNPGLTQLKRGETIRVPQWGSQPLPGAAQTGAEASVHWVQAGETLYSISRRYGVSVTALLEENPGARELKQGMRLTIPGRRTTGAGPGTLPASEEYSMHIIQQGETLYSLSKKFGVSADRLVALNPALDRSFKAGTEIRVPRVAVVTPAVTPAQGEGTQRHIVAAGETLFSISGKYGVEMGELVAANPVLEGRPPRTGDTLVVRGAAKPASAEVSAPGRTPSADCKVKTSYHDPEEVRVALLLPLMIDANRYLNAEFLSGKSDDEPADGNHPNQVAATPYKEGYISFQGSSENFLHFYEGALMAVDSLRQMGIKVRLDVYDTEQKPAKVKSLVASGDLEHADLIIGPVFPNEQKEISDYARERQITVVSPLSASDEVTKGNPYFIQINPPREFVAQKTVEHMVASYPNGNLVVLQTGNSSVSAEKEAELLRLEIARKGGNDGKERVKLVNYRKEGFSVLREAMVNGRKNVILISSDNEAEVSVAVSNVKMLARDFDVTLIGNNRFPQFESINPESFHAGNLEYLTPYWPDTRQRVTRSFVSKFRNFYKGEPNQFSMQGYDALFYFTKAYSDFGKGMLQCIPNASAQLVQGNYRFEPLTSGGFINHGLIVVLYTSDFNIIRKN